MGCAGGGGSALIAPSSALLLPGQSLQFSEVGHSGDTDLVWLANGLVGGSASSGTIDSAGIYTAPGTVPSQSATVSIQGPSVAAVVDFFDPNHVIPGSVAATQNPLVAAYSIPVPPGALVSVQFGLDTGYGFSTSAVTAPPNGGNTTVLVAGMRASTTYHMQAVIDLSNGIKLLDADQTFTTGAIPADRIPNMTAQTTGVGAPSPGIELLSLVPPSAGNLLNGLVTDLEGNVIWYYDLPSNEFPFPIKQLPNGHMLANVAVIEGLAGNEVREVDLAGNIIQSASIGAVNNSLTGIVPVPFQLDLFHHDVAVLPNGHWILLGNYPETINNVPGIPAGTSILGDALVDWDPQSGSVAWTWSTFDHLDLTHAPFGFADWTHANAIIYSPTDGNLILSMRNQNWIIKIDYQNGAGAGDILWRFGPGGDFTLTGQEAPIDWNYGQHYPTILSPNSSGIFTLMFFDNGNFRILDSNGDVCGTPGVGPCFSSVPTFQVDEFAKSATLLWEDELLPSFSTCCGDAVLLPNGDVEYDIAADVNTPGFSHIQEATQTQSPELVWKMDIEGQLAYRGFRIPSLYPSEVWPATASSSPSRTLPAISLARSAQQLP